MPDIDPPPVVPDILHVVYVSDLAPGCDFSVYASICRTSRARNAQVGISGLLLFDGLQFVQWIFGPHDAVTDLMRVIARDDRHRDVRVVYESRGAPMALPASWRAGFVGPEAIERFVATFVGAQSAVAGGLEMLVGQADFDPDP